MLKNKCGCPWCRASGLYFTAWGTWFNPCCAQFASRQRCVRFYLGMRRSLSESNDKLLTTMPRKSEQQSKRLRWYSYALKMACIWIKINNKFCFFCSLTEMFFLNCTCLSGCKKIKCKTRFIHSLKGITNTEQQCAYSLVVANFFNPLRSLNLCGQY